VSELGGKYVQKTVAFHTLGCKVNQYETESMKELFERADYQVVSDRELADIYVINTCTVTKLSDRKSRQFIRRAKRKNPDAKVVAVGCYVQVAEDEVAAIEGIDLLLGTGHKQEIVKQVENLTGEGIRSIVTDVMKPHAYEGMTIETLDEKTRAFVKIQDGCNQFCAYCIIPYARGAIRSRNASNVIEELKRLIAAGYEEIVLTGIHLASYGLDLKEKGALIRLIEEADQLPGLRRLRLGSLEPKWITEDVAKRLGQLKTMTPHFHLSLQSGSDSVLSHMNRRYTTGEFKEAVRVLREYFEAPRFTTDLIVGFPGETEAEFAETMAYVQKIRFADIHVFPYSPREGTPAADFGDQIDGTIKAERARVLSANVRALREEIFQSYLNATKEVLLEKQWLPDGSRLGHLADYTPVAVANANADDRWVMVRMERADAQRLYGSVES
jgi:threonylcarbamoyladenosine tRNA methylthiotransferase MtaB